MSYWIISRYSERHELQRFRRTDVQVHSCTTVHEAKSFINGERKNLKPELMVRHTLIVGHQVEPPELTDSELRELLETGWEEFRAK